MQHVIAERYRLDREIGRGGMGAVWLGRDVVLDRVVALKQVGMLPGSDRADRERVLREARVSAMLIHANVVGVFDLVAEGGRHWLVMEYVDSETLADLIRRRGALGPDELAPVVCQAAEALAAAHRAGIVHRDVKPSNILIARDGTVKLGDFGIARTTTDATLTQTGMVTGSPGYMAPEVAAGHAATRASDVWSLGATLYHGLTGRPPYDGGDNLMSALYRLVHEEPPRTDRAGWLAPLLLATMHRDPAGRWTAEQVAAYLRRGPVDGPPAGPPLPPQATTTPPGPPPGVLPGPRPAPVQVGEPTRLVAPMHPRRRSATVAALGVLVLVCGLTVAVWLLGRGGSDPTMPAATGATTATTTLPAGAELRPTAAGMERFVRDYLATVARDPARAWTRLTPGFQRASGGYRSYVDWWGGLERATVTSVRANPADLTVSYRVRYEWARGAASGKLRSDDPTLELTFLDGVYLIDYERK